MGNTLPGARQPHSPAAPCVTCGKPFLSELSSSLGLPNRGRRSRASASLEGVDWADLLDDVPEIADDLMEFQGRVGALFDVRPPPAALPAHAHLWTLAADARCSTEAPEATAQR